MKKEKVPSKKYLFHDKESENFKSFSHVEN